MFSPAQESHFSFSRVLPSIYPPFFSPIAFQGFCVLEQPAVPRAAGAPCCHSDGEGRGAWLPARGSPGCGW